MPARHVALRVLAVGAVVLLGACDGDEGGATGPGDGAEPAPVQEGPVAATAFVVGDCLNGIVLGAAERAAITSAEVVSCDRDHGLEVYATFDLDPTDLDLADPAEYPGPVRVVQVAERGCTERIEELAEEPDSFGLIALWPSQISWATGDRQVACVLFSPEGTPFRSRQL